MRCPARLANSISDATGCLNNTWKCPMETLSSAFRFSEQSLDPKSDVVARDEYELTCRVFAAGLLSSAWPASLTLYTATLCYDVPMQWTGHCATVSHARDLRRLVVARMPAGLWQPSRRVPRFFSKQRASSHSRATCLSREESLS